MKKFFLLLTICAFTSVACESLLFHKEPETTTFKVTRNSTFDVISIGADIAVNYRITKPIEGVSVVATPSADWITERTSLQNALVFNVTANDTDAVRTATITLIYNDIEQEVTITQAAAGSDTEEYTKFEYLSGHYWGNNFCNTDSGHHYAIILGNSGNCRDMASGDLNLVKGNNYLFIELFSATAPEKLNREFNVPVGNYAYDISNSGKEGTILEQSTLLRYYDGKDGKESEFVNGSVTVTEECIYANFVDKKGNEYKYYCSTRYVDNVSNFGPVNVPENQSTLTGDLNITFSDCEAYASCYGDNYFIGKNYWDIFLIDNATGDTLSIKLLSDENQKVPTGTFPISTDLTIGDIALPGYANCEDVEIWSWYILYTSDRDVLGSAPIMDGEVKIEDNGDTTYSIVIDVVDDLGNKITGLLSGSVIVGL